MLNKAMVIVGSAITVLLIYLTTYNPAPVITIWTDEELAILRSLRLPSKWEINDPSNNYLLNPQAALLGKLLFSDTQLSRYQQIACASCHQPEHYFTLAANSDISLDKQVPTLLGIASFNWFMLDGSADSLWAQALKPLENHIEHGGTRTQYVQYVLNRYPQLYQTVFGSLPALLMNTILPEQASPTSQYEEEQKNWQWLSIKIQTEINRVYANIGKSLAAYQATLWPRDTRFDRYIDQVTEPSRSPDIGGKPLLSENEIAGLKLFISEQGQCIRCHNGALFSNGDFHATTVPTPHLSAQKGRFTGVEHALKDPFNCLGYYSDSESAQCKELIFIKRASDELKGATKVPNLRNIADTAPYMHAGQFSTLTEVLHYYNRAATPFGTHSDLAPLKLLPYQLNQLEVFLLTLSEENIDEPTR
ncbi:cytochrome-c peroxidase [Photobacterium indicum]|uniref:cytochrome-c peroxidase n=1 Tax=Photobacterium indicum TaxID=81447 RepID=UPI003D11AA29